MKLHSNCTFPPVGSILLYSLSFSRFSAFYCSNRQVYTQAVSSFRGIANLGNSCLVIVVVFWFVLVWKKGRYRQNLLCSQDGRMETTVFYWIKGLLLLFL
jgi:hypothetical protein